MDFPPLEFDAAQSVVRYLLVYLPKFRARTQSPDWPPQSKDRMVRRIGLEGLSVVSVSGQPKERACLPSI
jgi:hypothetical protein